MAGEEAVSPGLGGVDCLKSYGFLRYLRSKDTGWAVVNGLFGGYFGKTGAILGAGWHRLGGEGFEIRIAFGGHGRSEVWASHVPRWKLVRVGRTVDRSTGLVTSFFQAEPNFFLSDGLILIGVARFV